MARPKEFAEEEVLEKAMQVFWRNGYYNTSMQDLVDGMGICRASLYDTFGDKHALYIKALEHYRTTNARNMEKAIANAITNRTKIAAIFDRLIDEIATDPDQKGCFMTNAALEMLPKHDPTVGQLVCGNFGDHETAFAHLLRQGIASGEFRADLPVVDTARFLLGTTGGLRIVGKMQSDREALTGMVRVAMSVLD